MKLALLVGANPRTSSGGPWIKLHEGEWRISSVERETSEIVVSLADDPRQYFIDTVANHLCVIGPKTVKIGFMKRGTESHLSVYAEYIGGPKS